MSVAFQLLVVGNVTDRLGTRNASNVGFLSAVLFFALMPLVHSVPTMLLAVVLFALGMSLTNATIAALLTDAAPPNARGTVLGVGSSMESISGIIMPTISTGVLALYGTAWTASISLLFVAIALALGLIAKRREVPVAP
jgi:MFS family permease